MVTTRETILAGKIVTSIAVENLVNMWNNGLCNGASKYAIKIECTALTKFRGPLGYFTPKGQN